MGGPACTEGDRRGDLAPAPLDRAMLRYQVEHPRSTRRAPCWRQSSRQHDQWARMVVFLEIASGTWTSAGLLQPATVGRAKDRRDGLPEPGRPAFLRIKAHGTATDEPSRSRIRRRHCAL